MGERLPPRVLHLIDTGGPGGAETVCLELVTGLTARGWKSTVVIPSIDWLSRSLRARGIEHTRLAGEGSFDVSFLRALVRLIRRERIDIVQTHLLGSAVYGSLAARVARRPTVCTFHGPVDISEGESYLRAKTALINRRNADLVFVSGALREHFRANLLGGAEARAGLHVVHNGIDMSSFQPVRQDGLRRELGLGSNVTLIGAIGNVRPAKDYPTLLRAAACLSDRDDLHFAIIGHAREDLATDLGRLRGELGLEDRVTFVPFQEDVHQVFQSLDVFVLSSSTEGFSLSTLQAVASGVPVVATRCGGPEEIVDPGKSGVLTGVGSGEELADGLRRVLRGELTGGEQPRTSQRVRLADVGRFTLEAMVHSYEALYARRLGRPDMRSDGAAA